MHQKIDGLTDEGVPVERDSVAFVITDTKKKGAAYYDAKRTLEYIFTIFGISVTYRSFAQEEDAVFAPFEPKRSAVLFDEATGLVIGVVGEYRKAVQKAFKLADYTAGFEIDPRAVLELSQQVGRRYQPLSRYPGTERDVCFQVSEATTYAQVFDAAKAALDVTGLITAVEPLDIYQPSTGEVKNVTLRMRLGSYEKTMTNDEATTVINQVIDSVIQATDGKVI